MNQQPAPWVFDRATLKLGDMDVQALLEKHVGDAAQRELFGQFMRAWLAKPGKERDEPAQRIHEVAAKKPELRFANEFEGDLLLREQKRVEALSAYLREASFDDARRARRVAFSTALALEDRAALRSLCSDARCVREIDPYQFYDAAKLLQDRWLIVRSLAAIEWRQWSESMAVPLALFSALVWYLILVHSAGLGRFRWLRYLSPVFAGVMSVWLLNWWQSSLHYQMPEEDGGADPTQELFQWVIHVGVPEETAKLCLFAVFVPLLLRRGSPHGAALTAGCVGLGFALDENLQYYSNFGAGVAVGRLVTANFMHVAMTGLIGFWYYELFRSRFHRAGEFVTVFAGVAAAHGAYDFAQSRWAADWGGQVASVVILGLLAKLYFQHLHPPGVRGRRPAVSSTVDLFIGMAIVVGAAVVIAVWQSDTMHAVSMVFRETLSVLPIAVLFMREFAEMEN